MILGVQKAMQLKQWPISWIKNSEIILKMLEIRFLEGKNSFTIKILILLKQSKAKSHSYASDKIPDVNIKLFSSHYFVFYKGGIKQYMLFSVKYTNFHSTL